MVNVPIMFNQHEIESERKVKQKILQSLLKSLYNLDVIHQIFNEENFKAVMKHSFSFSKRSFSSVPLFYCSFFSLHLLALLKFLFSFDGIEDFIAIFITISGISIFKLLKAETFKQTCILLKI